MSKPTKTQRKVLEVLCDGACIVLECYNGWKYWAALWLDNGSWNSPVNITTHKILRDRGWITPQDTAENKHRYIITDAGREALKEVVL